MEIEKLLQKEFYPIIVRVYSSCIVKRIKLIANRPFIRCLYTTKSLKKPFETMSRLRHKQENRGDQLETYQVLIRVTSHEQLSLAEFNGE